MADRNTAVLVRDNYVFAGSDFYRVDRSVSAVQRPLIEKHDIAVVIHNNVLSALAVPYGFRYTIMLFFPISSFHSGKNPKK